MARQGWGRHSTVATGSDSGDQVSVNAWNADINKAGMLGFTAQTIASATSISPTNSTIILSGSTDVSTIAITDTAEYDLLYVFTSGTVTLVNTSSPSSDGDIRLLANANKDLSTTTPTILIRKDNYWYEYGGGITNALDDIGDVVITSVANEDVLAYDSTTSKWINQSADETGRVTASSTTTFTNKTIDQDGTGNSITNIANASIKAAAAIDATKIADGSVTSTEFQYINTLSSNAQTQLDGKSPTAGSSSITTVGTIGSGTWQGTAIADSYVASASTWNGKQNALTFGIANTNTVKIDSADAASGEYAKLTASGIESKSFAEVKTDLSLNNVENTAISTFAGSTNITTLGTIATGTWSATAIGETKGGTGQTTYTQGDILYASGANTLSKLAKGTAGQVLTINSGATAPEWATSSGGASTLLDFKYQASGYSTPTYTTRTVNDASTPVQMWVKDIDTNNQGIYIRIKKNGTYTNVQIA